MSGLAGYGRQALAAVIVFALASVVGTATGDASGMMGGGSGSGSKGFSFVPNITLGVPLIAAPVQTPHCRPPQVFVQGQGCLVPGKPTKPDKPAAVIAKPPPDCAKFGEVYSPKTGGCVPPARQAAHCTFPEVAGAGGGCVCARGYVSNGEGCMPAVGKTPPPTHTVSCSYPMVQEGSSCACGYGTFWNGDQCVKSPTIVITPPPVVITNPAPAPPVVVGGPTPPPPPPGAIDVLHIQQCLQKLGYYTGAVDGSAGDGTRSAFRAYQQASGFAGRPPYLGDSATLSALYQKCSAPANVTPVSLPKPVAAPARCLAPDLYDMLKTTYGKDPTLPACTPQTAACVPKPLSFDGARLQSVAASSGVTWCDDKCIRLGSYLPLSTILTIETAAHVTLCASPAALCYAPGRPVVEKQIEVRTIYKNLPVGAGNEGNIAVVIGNETYGNDITPHVYGHADADAVVQLLTEQLGYHKDNIIDLRDAKLADLERVFGSADNAVGELATRVKAQHGQTPPNVIVYVSSHGMAKEDGGTAYLLPVDGKTDDLDHTGYPLQQLYTNLGRAGANTIMLMLEASFTTSITDAIDAPNLPQLEVAAMPESPVAGLAVFTASDRDQHALEDPEYGIGLFTRYMIAGLAGDADAPPIGKGDKRIDTVELYVYTADKVRNAARKSFGVEQKPILSKIDNLVVGTLASN